MQYYNIEDMRVSKIGIGCMRLGDLSDEQAKEYLDTLIGKGVNFFDHADIYGGGACETRFGTYLKNHPEVRSKIYIQSKCGIERNVGYNFDKDYILKCVDQSLERLQCGYLDVLLLHRPDTLMDPVEVSQAFSILKNRVKFVTLA